MRSILKTCGNRWLRCLSCGGGSILPQVIEAVNDAAGWPSWWRWRWPASSRCSGFPSAGPRVADRVFSNRSFWLNSGALGISAFAMVGLVTPPVAILYARHGLSTSLAVWIVSIAGLTPIGDRVGSGLLLSAILILALEPCGRPAGTVAIVPPGDERQE